MLSAICFNLDQSKILLSGNELKGSLEHIVRKGENAGNAPFPTMFSTTSILISILRLHLFSVLQML